MFKKTITRSIMVSLLTASTLLASSNSHSKQTTTTHHSTTHWDYTDTTIWGSLNQKYTDCSIGQRQSPIDIQTHTTINALTFKDIFVSYKNTKLNIINNGHTIQVNSDGTSKAILNGKEFKLLQFHFHALSEHTINKEYSNMEVHLVHQAEDGELAVIGVMMEIGKKNEFIEKIFTNMPKNSGEKVTNETLLNANDLLPNDRSYYHYIGSLTTPPCTQIVQWYVLQNPILISKEQLEKFHELYKGNYRPTQPVNSRIILKK